jgi:hypothetical protein
MIIFCFEFSSWLVTLLLNSFSVFLSLKSQVFVLLNLNFGIFTFNKKHAMLPLLWLLTQIMDQQSSHYGHAPVPPAQ